MNSYMGIIYGFNNAKIWRTTHCGALEASEWGAP